MKILNALLKRFCLAGLDQEIFQRYIGYCQTSMTELFAKIVNG